MGAYDNPKIIQQPDYGQIFSRNFQAGLSQQQAIKDRAEKRREKEKMQDQRLADRELAFATNIGKIEAGDLTASLQRLGFSEADSYSENERLWADNKISRDEYSKNRSNSFRKIQELAQIGKSLELQSKNFETLDESKFQNDPRSVGLIEAWKEKKMQFQYVGNEVEIYYNDGKKNVMVDIDDLKNNDFFNINQRVELEDSEYANLAKIANPQIESKSISTYDSANTKTTTITKKYKQDKQIYIDRIANSGKMAKLFSDKNQAGSLFVDTVHSILKGSNRLGDEADNFIENNAGLKALPEKEKEAFRKAFIDNTVYNNTKYRDALDDLSKKVLAEEAFNNHLPQSQRVFNAGGSSTEQASPSDLAKKLAEEKKLKDFNEKRNEVIKTASPFTADGKKAKSDGQLSKGYAGVSMDGLPGVPSGAGITIRSANVVNPKGAPTGSYLVQFKIGSVKGGTNEKNSIVLDLGDPDILRQLQSNMSQLGRYGSYKGKLVDSFVPESEDKDVNLSAADLIKKYSN